MQIIDCLLIGENFNLIKSPEPNKELNIQIQYNFKQYNNTDNVTPISISFRIKIECEHEEVVNANLKYFLSIKDLVQNKDEIQRFILDGTKIELNSEINHLLLKAQLSAIPLNQMEGVK